MSLHRRAAKRDDNEREIITTLKRAGASVTQLSGEGVPDLLVGFKGATHLLEVKGPGCVLTPAQTEWHRYWTGSRVYVVTAPAEATAALLAPGAPPTTRKRRSSQPRKPQTPPRALPEIE